MKSHSSGNEGRWWPLWARLLPLMGFSRRKEAGTGISSLCNAKYKVIEIWKSTVVWSFYLGSGRQTLRKKWGSNTRIFEGLSPKTPTIPHIHIKDTEDFRHLLIWDFIWEIWGYCWNLFHCDIFICISHICHILLIFVVPSCINLFYIITLLIKSFKYFIRVCGINKN